ncbi:MAG TPA: SDR family NAD(P)-dependent oxidoreductase [Verrucomicrobiota bacterium]|nr:SDR family NAD(P)-dependent oxidoreductase [Verrucomicrobiota bacterium]
MNPRFQDQVAIITGGADGLGKAIARRLASEGARLALMDRNPALLGQTATEFESCGWATATYSGDVANESDVERAFDAVASEFGRLDIMVNSAGIVGPTNRKIVDVPLTGFDEVQAVNLRGSFLTAKHAIRHMLRRNYGRVLLIASIAGKEGNAGMCCYSASKAGVIGLTKSVGKEYAETGITVNALAPAVIRTAMVENMPVEQVKYMTDKIPMKRCGTLEEVAAMVAFVVSPEAAFNTGAIFDLSGGRATY